MSSLSPARTWPCSWASCSASRACAGVRVRALPAVGLLTVVVFVFIARPEPSLLRAAVMGIVGVIGLAAGRRGRAAPALCAAVVVLVLVDPWLARSYGFALSVVCDRRPDRPRATVARPAGHADAAAPGPPRSRSPLRPRRSARR